jgi:hypothetical protein
VESVQKHRNTQASEGIDEGCQQFHRRNQTLHNSDYVADESRNQQDRCHDHSNQRYEGCILDRHTQSISVLKAINKDTVLPSPETRVRPRSDSCSTGPRTSKFADMSTSDQTCEQNQTDAQFSQR